MEEVSSPLMEGLDISPRYIGNVVYNPPSTIPIKNLLKDIKTIVFEYAKRMNIANVIGVKHKITDLRPIISTIITANSEPKGAPKIDITAHQEPWELVILISGYVPFKICGR